eukprot:scaffold88669_cov81-Cyclotella_meneghiniana.AAC.1
MISFSCEMKGLAEVGRRAARWGWKRAVVFRDDGVVGGRCQLTATSQCGWRHGDDITGCQNFQEDQAASAQSEGDGRRPDGI